MVVEELVVVVGVVVALILGALAVELVLPLEDSLVQMIGLVQCKTIFLYFKGFSPPSKFVCVCFFQTFEFFIKFLSPVCSIDHHFIIQLFSLTFVVYLCGGSIVVVSHILV